MTRGLFGQRGYDAVRSELLVRPHLAVAAVLLVALAVRLWGIDYGLPHVYHTDEWFEVKRALKLGAGVVDFDRVGKGGYYLLLFVLYGAYYVALRAFDLVGGADDFLIAFFDDPTPMWLIGRVTTALIGTVNCWLMYVLGTRWHSRGVGLAAAAFLSIHPLHVNSSHNITVDVPLVTLLTALLAVMYRREGPDRVPLRDYLALGALLALATATKITAAPAVFAVFAYHASNVHRERGHLAWRQLADRRLAAFAATFAVIYVAAEPGILFQAASVARFALSFVSPTGTQAAELPLLVDEGSSLAVRYLSWLFPVRYAGTTLLFVVGCALSLARHDFRRHLGLWFAVPYVWCLLGSNSPDLVYARYVLPLTPVVWLYAAFGFVRVVGWFAGARRVAAMACVTVAATSIGPMTWETIETDWRRTLPDTRTFAKDWVHEHVAEGSVIYMEGGIVTPSPMTAPLAMAPELVGPILSATLGRRGEVASEEKSGFYEAFERSLAKRKTYHLVLLENRHQLRDALDRGIGDWVVLRSEALLPFEQETNRERFPERWRFLQWLEESFEPIEAFSPTDSVNGPEIVIYRRDAKSAGSRAPEPAAP